MLFPQINFSGTLELLRPYLENSITASGINFRNFLHVLIADSKSLKHKLSGSCNKAAVSHLCAESPQPVCCSCEGSGEQRKLVTKSCKHPRRGSYFCKPGKPAAHLSVHSHPSLPGSTPLPRNALYQPAPSTPLRWACTGLPCFLTPPRPPSRQHATHRSDSDDLTENFLYFSWEMGLPTSTAYYAK